MSPRLNPQVILESIVSNGQLIEPVWLDVCSQVFTQNAPLFIESFDQFILQCCRDFDPLIAALPSSLQARACDIAAGWGYESSGSRAVRYSCVTAYLEPVDQPT